MKQKINKLRKEIVKKDKKNAKIIMDSRRLKSKK